MQSDSRLLFFIDVLFCQFVVVTCNILVWRGVWNVYDAFLYPEDHLLSDVVSLVLGYVLCIVLFFLQWPAGTSQPFPPLTVSLLRMATFHIALQV